MKYIAIDIGGSWIKGVVTEGYSFDSNPKELMDAFQVQKVKSPLNAYTTVDQLLCAFQELFEKFNTPLEDVTGFGISTPGIVNYHGTRLLSAGSHLNILKSDQWKNEIQNRFNCPVFLINDADSATIGLAEMGALHGDKSIGIMPVGTGLGFSIWKNGRRWRPGKMLPLLGSAAFNEKEYNEVVSASNLANSAINSDLVEVLTNSIHNDSLQQYFKNFASIVATAATLYGLDELIICGGLVNAANTCEFSIIESLTKHIKNPFELFGKQVHIKTAYLGNHLQLLGSLALIHGELHAQQSKVSYAYRDLDTEVPYQSDFKPEKMKSAEIVHKLWEAEQEAGRQLEKSLDTIAAIVDQCLEKVQAGGRIIYVGAGTSGRIAAIDAVEIPVTYGFPKDRILALIAGGITEASMEIESDFEEDASAVPEMLLLNIQPEDSVIGISASGTAYYVQSALAFAKKKQALAIMLQTKKSKEALRFCDHIIPLESGSELISGSTRMKAGTATKKVLNFFSTTLMIKLGKVIGSHMVDLVCTNDKLLERAQHILTKLYAMDNDEAKKRLERANMDLRRAIEELKETL